MKLVLTLWLAAAVLTGCSIAPATPGTVQVTLLVDGNEQVVSLPEGSTLKDAYAAAGIVAGSLDRSDPPLSTLLAEDLSARLVRVKEEFQVEQVVIPFERREIVNESVPTGETRLVQPGVNGLQEITFRVLFEDGTRVSRSAVKSVLVTEAVPEIVMVGSQSPFASLGIPGRLAYLLAGSAWVIEGNTGERRPVVSTGKLDGRIFALSPDGHWLLYSEGVEADEGINRLWAVDIEAEEAKPVDLSIANVVHYAGWRENYNYALSYSTVEPRTSAPGWQANNDLNLAVLSAEGKPRLQDPLIETNMGGTYGWWGVSFAWLPDGSRLSYARPDGVGLVELETGEMQSLIEMIPYQTGADWAWFPGMTWGPDGQVLYTIEHAPPAGTSAPEKSPVFDLVAIPAVGAGRLRLVSQAGMFAYPLASPLRTMPGGEKSYQVAYLQAIFPDQSDTSRYRVMVMDRDGSNRQVIFPAEGTTGLEPQAGWGAWSPAALQEGESHWLAILYGGNLWLVNPQSREAHQITGEGLVTRVDWK